MPRAARLVIPSYPHHVTQRGARRQRTFFSDVDYREYLDLLVAAMPKAGVSIWAYCLMPNHVHFVLVPERNDSLAVLFREAHRRYTRYVNFREGWRGHLWQERFHSFCMDERHLLAAVRYVELNPVHAGLCERPEDWHWSSARAHLGITDDPIINVPPVLGEIVDWSSYLDYAASAISLDTLRLHGRTGRPAGSDDFIKSLELLTGLYLRPRKPGRKPK